MKKTLYAVLIALPVLSVTWLALFPDVSRLERENPERTAMMEFREEEWEAGGRKVRLRHRWVPYSRISPYVLEAVVIAEDEKFWDHEGFDLEGIQRALEKDLKSGEFRSGGSTISQQLAKNLFLKPTKSPVRKLREAIITWRLERALTKRRILEIYLNVAEWGEGIFGIEAASRHHFGKSAAELTPMEAARLAAVLPNPRRLNASGSQPYVARRADVIYRIMAKGGSAVPEPAIPGPGERQPSTGE